MVEEYMLQNKNQFDVFDYEEDGSFKPIFMVGKCQIEEDVVIPNSPRDESPVSPSPIPVIEEK